MSRRTSGILLGTAQFWKPCPPALVRFVMIAREAFFTSQMDSLPRSLEAWARLEALAGGRRCSGPSSVQMQTGSRVGLNTRSGRPCRKSLSASEAVTVSPLYLRLIAHPPRAWVSLGKLLDPSKL